MYLVCWDAGEAGRQCVSSFVRAAAPTCARYSSKVFAVFLVCFLVIFLKKILEGEGGDVLDMVKSNEPDVTITLQTCVSRQDFRPGLRATVARCPCGQPV
jgi:hypothetical protein